MSPLQQEANSYQVYWQPLLAPFNEPQQLSDFNFDPLHPQIPRQPSEFRLKLNEREKPNRVKENENVLSSSVFEKR